MDFECPGRPPIQWHSTFDSNNGGSFFGMCKEEAKRLLGLTKYRTKDTSMGQQVQTKWCLNVPFTDAVIQVLCCPEDGRCIVCPSNMCGIHDMKCPLCPEREMPLCASCSDELSRAHPKMPPFALATKMWIGYINEYIYEHQATYIELFFASPDDTAMLSTTLQRFHDRVSGSSLGHLSNTRLGARGNVPFFSLPWEEILQTFSQNGGRNH